MMRYFHERETVRVVTFGGPTEIRLNPALDDCKVLAEATKGFVREAFSRFYIQAAALGDKQRGENGPVITTCSTYSYLSAGAGLEGL